MPRIAILAAAAAAMALTVTEAAEARGLPDLGTGAVKGRGGTAFVGSRLRLDAVVSNKGKGTAGRSTVGFYLSRNRSWSSADVPLGKAKAPKLARRARHRVTLRTRVPPTAPTLEPLFVLACADDALRVAERKETNNCAVARGHLTVGAKTSFGAIDLAQRSGKLKPPQALAYKVFAVFADRRLPKRYRFKAIGGSGTALMDHLLFSFQSLPQKWRNAIAPFLLPPAAARSFARPPVLRRDTAPDTCRIQQWNAVDAGGLAWVWYQQSRPQDQARAQALAGELSGTIWPRLTGLMGKTPLSDAGYNCHGSDGRLDVYLEPVGEAVTQQWAPTCGPSASEIVFPLSGPNGTRGALAHEFMHVMQKAYTRRSPCTDLTYLHDAAATWAEDYVYPDNSEHIYPQMLEIPDIAFGYPAESGYPAWVFLYSAATAPGRGGAAVIPNFQTAAATQKPLDALNSAVPGGFEKSWPLFARDGWNRKLSPALTASFFSWDSFRKTPPDPKKAYSLQGKKITYPLPIELYGLDRQYQHVDLSDKKAKLVTFEDPSASGTDPNLHTYAYFKLARGGWKGEDWTGRDKVEFCREKPSENVREVILVDSTSTYPKGPPGSGAVVKTDKPKLKLAKTCDLDQTYDVVSVSGSFNDEVKFESLTNSCKLTKDAHWTTALGPNPDPATLQVYSHDRSGRPIFAFNASRVPVIKNGNGTATRTCAEPDPSSNGSVSCTFNKQQDGLLDVSSNPDTGKAEPMNLEWVFGYNTFQYDPSGFGAGGNCSFSGPRPPTLSSSEDSPGLFVSPINDGTNIGEPVGKNSVSSATFGGDSVTLTFSGAGSASFSTEEETSSAQLSYTMTITLRPR
jgi:hypothetical protein